MSTFSLTRGSEAALGMLASQAGSETLLLTQPARELRAELSIEPFTTDSGDQLLAVLFMREQRHSMTLQRNDGANVQHLADWVEAVANGTLDTAEAIPQRTNPSDLQAATAAFNAAAHELNAQAEPAAAQDKQEAFEVEIPDIAAIHNGRYLVPYRSLEAGERLMTVAQHLRIEKQLRAALTRLAQTEQQPVAVVPEEWKAGFKLHEIHKALDCGLPAPSYWAETCDGEPHVHTKLWSGLPGCGSFHSSRFWPLYGVSMLAFPITQTAPQPEQSALEQALALAAARLDRLGLNQPVHSKAYREARDWADEAMVALRDYRAALATSATA